MYTVARDITQESRTLFIQTVDRLRYLNIPMRLKGLSKQG